jgi:hypothetical protein
MTTTSSKIGRGTIWTTVIANFFGFWVMSLHKRQSGGEIFVEGIAFFVALACSILTLRKPDRVSKVHGVLGVAFGVLSMIAIVGFIVGPKR